MIGFSIVESTNNLDKRIFSGGIDMRVQLEWVHEKNGKRGIGSRRGNSSGEFCWEGEQGNGAVAGRKVGVKGKNSMGKIIACLYTDGNGLVGG